jgi:hypothetical protein
LVGAALIVGVFYGCQKNQAIEDPSSSIVSKSIKDKLLIDEAKTYFESRLVELKKQKEAAPNKLKVRDNQNTDATFDALDVFPKWDNAKVIRQNGSSFVETPYEFEGNKQFGLSISKKSNIAPDEKSASRLIVRKNSSGVQSANFMSVSADDEYLNGNNTSLKNFTYESVPNKFKGNEMHFNIDGNFKNGWHFSDGKVNAIIKKKKVGSLGTRDNCWEEFCIMPEKYQYASQNQGGAFTVHANRPQCDYQMRLLYCEGWVGQDQWWNNNIGNNNNNWGGYNSTMFENISVNIMSPCNAQALNTLQTQGLSEDVDAFFQRFQMNNSINLKFDEFNDLDTDYNGKYEQVFTGQPGVNTWKISINLNAVENASEEFRASVILHEMIHVILEQAKLVSGNQHPYMADQCIEGMAAMLVKFYPRLKLYEAKALMYNGLDVDHGSKYDGTTEGVNMIGIAEDFKNNLRGNMCHD